MDLANIETKEDLQKAMKEIGEQMMARGRMDQLNKVKSFKALNQCAQKGQILFTGSSLMEQFPVSELSLSHGLGKVVYNRGIGGTTTEDFLREIDTVLLDLEPSVVFINIGTNDMRVWDDGRDWLKSLLDNYEKILKICKERLPETKVYLMAYYPVNARVADEWTRQSMLRVRTNENVALANEKVSELAAKYGYEYIDVNQGLTDEDGNLKAEYTIEGVHMYASAYEVVFRNLLKYL